MSGGRGNNNKDDEGSGWASTFLKVAGAVAATAAVAGSIYSMAKQPEVGVAQAPFGGVQQPHRQAPFGGVQQPHRQEGVILKVDGSLLPTSAGCGGYLSSESQKWICGFTQKLNPNLNSDKTEREAILRGLLWVKEKGMKKVVVKTDNEGIENLVNSGSRSIDPVICAIRDLLKSNQWEASLCWISGNDNAVADRLAHKAHSSSSFDLQEIDYPPQNCIFLL